MADLTEYGKLFEKLKGGEVVVPQSREEAFKLAFLNAMIGDRISMDQLEFCDEITSKLVSKIPYMFYAEGRAVVYNNEIHILGDKEYSGNLVKYHYKWDGSAWTEVSTLPYSFIGGCAIVYNNEIHILGGTNNKKKHYKWDGSAWTEVSTLPYDYYGYSSQAVVYNNEIHILGSDVDAEINGKKHYKWDGSTWTEVSTLPYSFYFGETVVFNDEIHILGGTDKTNNMTKHYKWDGSVWTEVSTLPYSFYFGSAVIYNNEIHILGGDENGNKYNADVSGAWNWYQHYKWDGSNWIKLSILPYPFMLGNTVVFNDEIHILGSSNNPYTHYKLLSEPLKLYTIKESN